MWPQPAISRLRSPARSAAAAAMLVAAGLLILFASPTGAQTRSVLVATVRGSITPVISDHLREGLGQAEEQGHDAFLVRVDTPGGLDASMREIIQAFLGAEVPVIVHVAPAGARAASAGALITMSAHIAAMAPGTAIGAATPVDLQGGDISEKVINDAAAYAESIATLRGRDVDFAVEAVREGRSAPAEEAVDIGVVDLMAENTRELLQAIDGRTVRLADGAMVTLRTGGAHVVYYEMGLPRRVLQWLADPNLAFLFLSIGTLAIVYELASPGVGAGGIVGVVLILLALFGLSVLPVNALGVVMMVLAAILYAAEILTPGVGVFAAGGTASLVLGGLFLFRGRVGVDPTVLAPVAIVVGGGVIVAGRFAWRSRRLATSTGTGGLVGRQTTVRTADGRTGQALIDGAWWNVRAEDDVLRVGARVRVVQVDGLDLIVEVQDDEEPDDEKARLDGKGDSI